MTNIDHDALARRIACEINLASYIEYRDIGVVSSLIATVLREALPTSEDEIVEELKDTYGPVVLVTGKMADGYKVHNVFQTAGQAAKYAEFRHFMSFMLIKLHVPAQHDGSEYHES